VRVVCELRHTYLRLTEALQKPFAPTPYCKVQTLFDEAFIRGRRYYFKSNFTRRIGDEMIDTLVEHFRAASSRLSMVYFQQLDDDVSREVPQNLL
jgi:hypothetical protein